MDQLEEYRQLCRVRLDNVVEVREPLVLVSQIQRSGGTLLSQLFDGHPACHAHPYELHLRKEHSDARWPKLDLRQQPHRWFELLYEWQAARHLLSGYSKPGQKVEIEVFPFLFLPRLQKRIFDKCVAARRIERDRDVYDCYFTSYFNAWLDNQNLYTGPKKLITAFTPRASFHRGGLRRMFDAYPDGRVISLVREPRAWYASASRHREKYKDLETSIALWRRSAEAAIHARARYGERVVVLTYEELIEETEAAMGRLAEKLGIAMLPILLVPTFNGLPILPNSSDAVQDYGIRPERARAYRDVLDPGTIARIDDLAGDLYEQVCALTGANAHAARIEIESP
jgi:Sulfotransferase family